MGIDEIIAEVNKIGQAVVFLGDGVAVFETYIHENCTVPYTFAPVSYTHLDVYKRQEPITSAIFGIKLKIIAYKAAIRITFGSYTLLNSRTPVFSP